MRSLLLAAGLALTTPASALAFGGGLGCTDLPEYYRAVGALEGMASSCGISVEDAQRIVAREGGQLDGGRAPAGNAAPWPRHRRHRRLARP